MSRLAFMSHQDPQLGRQMYEKVRELLPAKQARMLYLASDFKRNGEYFHNQRDIYASFDIELKDLMEMSDGLENRDILLQGGYAGIHLSGGNTPKFLRLMRQHGLLIDLHTFASQGNLIVGVSAGAILMTPSVITAQSVGDDFTDVSSDISALGLVDFHFWPHYQVTQASAAQALAENLGCQIYAASDGSGIIVQNNDLEFVGNIIGFGR